MAAILTGVLLLGWGAMASARALLALRGLSRPAVDQLAVPAGVWLLGAGLLAALVPATTLIGQHTLQALIWSLVLLTLLCAVSPLSFWWAQRRAQHAGNSRHTS